MSDTKFDMELLGGVEAKCVAFADGGVIFIKGDPGDSAYVLVSGRVEIRSGGHVIETMEPGEMFGEMALIDFEPRSASAVAVGRCELIMIDQSVFERLLREEGFALKVMRLMSRRLRTTLASQRAVPGELPVGVPAQKAG